MTKDTSSGRANMRWTVSCPSTFSAELRMGYGVSAVASPIVDVSDARRVIASVLSRYPEARGHGFAWRLGSPPSERHGGHVDAGPAERAILDEIVQRELVDVAVVVVRFFDDDLAGGLAAIYGAAAAGALDRATVVEWVADSEPRDGENGT